MAWPLSDQMKVMSRLESCDAAHCILAFSPTLTSALEGASVILVASKKAQQEELIYISGNLVEKAHNYRKKGIHVYNPHII